MENFIKVKGNKIFLKVHINPNSKKNEIVGIFDNSLKIKISSPPVDGKANKAIIKFFSKFLNIPKSKIKIEKGDKSRDKLIAIEGFNESALKKLQEVADANL